MSKVGLGTKAKARVEASVVTAVAASAVTAVAASAVTAVAALVETMAAVLAGIAAAALEGTAAVALEGTAAVIAAVALVEITALITVVGQVGEIRGVRQPINRGARPVGARIKVVLRGVDRVGGAPQIQQTQRVAVTMVTIQFHSEKVPMERSKTVAIQP